MTGTVPWGGVEQAPVNRYSFFNTQSQFNQANKLAFNQYRNQQRTLQRTADLAAKEKERVFLSGLAGPNKRNYLDQQKVQNRSQRFNVPVQPSMRDLYNTAIGGPLNWQNLQSWQAPAQNMLAYIINARSRDGKRPVSNSFRPIVNQAQAYDNPFGRFV